MRFPYGVSGGREGATNTIKIHFCTAKMLLHIPKEYITFARQIFHPPQVDFIAAGPAEGSLREGAGAEGD